MMIYVWILFSYVVGAFGDHLENVYLPTRNSNFLQTPHKSLLAPPPISSYVPPPSGPVPSTFYKSSFNKNQFVPSAKSIAILQIHNENNGLGQYKFNYETENRIQQTEFGQIRNVGNEQTSVVEGSYSYTGPDGKIYTINYIADENGFRPTGDHIPTPPPIPAGILKSLSGRNGHLNR